MTISLSTIYLWYGARQRTKNPLSGWQATPKTSVPSVPSVPSVRRCFGIWCPLFCLLRAVGNPYYLSPRGNFHSKKTSPSTLERQATEVFVVGFLSFVSSCRRHGGDISPWRMPSEIEVVVGFVVRTRVWGLHSPKCIKYSTGVYVGLPLS
jgi:hypothetical protein